MVNILRRWNQPIMVVITVLVVVAFTFWGPSFNRHDASSQAVAKLYGRDLPRSEFERASKRVQIFAQLGGPYIQTIFPNFGGFHNQVLDNLRPGEMMEIVARSLVIDHECEALGIVSTDQERLNVLDSLVFLRDRAGTFDPRTLAIFKTRFLNPNGYTEDDFDRIFLDGEARLKKLRELVGGTTTPTPADIREIAANETRQTDASYAAFKAVELKKEVKVTEDEIKKSYEEGKATYKTPEYRKIRYAAFLLPPTPDGKPRTGADRSAALGKLADSAYNLAQALKKPGANFDELAKKGGATVEETKTAFSQTETPPEFEDEREVTEAAFALTKEQPYSEHISIDPKGSYVLQLKEVIEPQQQKLEEVKAKVEDALRLGKAKELARARATELQPKLAESIKGGKKFAEAVQALNLNLKVEEFPSFSGKINPRGAYMATIVPATFDLAPGQISGALVDTSTGDALIVHLDSRSEDPKKITEDIPELEHSITQRTGAIAFRSWLYQRELAAGMGTAFRDAAVE